jgi:hypothetical protein
VRSYSLDHATAAGLMREQLDAYVAAARSYSDFDLLAASRVHGWSRLEVVVHTRLGLEEMAGVCAAQVEGEPDHDAASYWESFAADDDDPVPHIMWTRRTSTAYNRPEGALRHLDDVAAILRIALSRMPDHPVLFQGKTMTSGDFLATWVVELAVHQLDLGDGLVHPPPEALQVVRRTIEAVADVDLPAAWGDEDAALISLGRVPLPPDAGALADVLPISF